MQIDEWNTIKHHLIWINERLLGNREAAEKLNLDHGLLKW